MRSQLVIPSILAVVVLVGGTTAYSSICSFSNGNGFFDPGPSYCHLLAQVNHHILDDCPCRAQGSVSATGPFACTFHSYVAWGGPYGTSTIQDDAPVAMVTDYDISIDCGESFKVSVHCECHGRPRHLIFMDQGSCDGPCGDE